MDSLDRDFTILVVEDQGFIASEFDDAVRRNGGRVLGPATRLSEALALIETARCDGALLDVLFDKKCIAGVSYGRIVENKFGYSSPELRIGYCSSGGIVLTALLTTVFDFVSHQPGGRETNRWRNHS